MQRVLCSKDRAIAVENRTTIRLRQDETARAAELLRAGETVAIPTETVYGLAANALDAAAVARIFEAKQRPSWDPLIVHLSDASEVTRVVQEVPDAARKLMERFWPGPLTLLLPKTDAVPDAVTAGRPLVGVRVPAHPVAREVIRLAGVPLAAPSANRFGHVSPTRAEHVLADLDGRIAAVLDAGPCAVGLESTVVDATQSPMVLYRAGAVTKEEIEAVAGPVVIFKAPEEHTAPESLPSPGVGMRHYAPRAQVMLVHSEAQMLEMAEACGVRSVGVLLPTGWRAPSGATAVVAWAAMEDGRELAHLLFDRLRELDARGVDVILCPLPDGSNAMVAALRDRLEKAARVR